MTGAMSGACASDAAVKRSISTRNSSYSRQVYSDSPLRECQKSCAPGRLGAIVHAHAGARCEDRELQRHMTASPIGVEPIGKLVLRRVKRPALRVGEIRHMVEPGGRMKRQRLVT